MRWKSAAKARIGEGGCEGFKWLVHTRLHDNSSYMIKIPRGLYSVANDPRPQMTNLAADHNCLRIFWICLIEMPKSRKKKKLKDQDLQKVKLTVGKKRENNNAERGKNIGSRKNRIGLIKLGAYRHIWLFRSIKHFRQSLSSYSCMAN